MKDYNQLELDITLNKMGYYQEDIDELFSEPFDTLYSTRIGYQWHPSAVGWAQIDITLIVAKTLAGITSGILNQIGSDIVTWTKQSLRNVLSKKDKSFDNSFINIKFEDKTITINVNKSEEILQTMEKIETIILFIKHSDLYQEQDIHLHFTDVQSLVS